MNGAGYLFLKYFFFFHQVYHQGAHPNRTCLCRRFEDLYRGKSFIIHINYLERVLFSRFCHIVLGPFFPWLESPIRLERFKRYIKSFVPYLINLLYLHRTFLHQCTVVLTYHVLYKNVNQPISSLVISNTSMNSIASKSHLKQDSLFHFIVMFSFNELVYLEI